MATGNVTEGGGTLKITGVGNWGTNVNNALPNGVNEAQGVVLDVKYDPGTAAATVYLDTGTWAQSNYRRWGLYVDSTAIKLNRYIGSTSTRRTLLALKTNVWYRMLLDVGHDGNMIAAVWERDNPAEHAVAREARTEFANQNWRFYAQSHTGTLHVDNYAEMTLHQTQYAYDVLGNLTTVTDAAGNVTRMWYDKLSRKTAMTDPDMGHWTYSYDDAGNLKTQTDARGCTIFFNYDNINRLTEKIFNNSAPSCYSSANVAYTPDVTYTWTLEKGHLPRLKSELV